MKTIVSENKSSSMEMTPVECSEKMTPPILDKDLSTCIKECCDIYDSGLISSMEMIKAIVNNISAHCTDQGEKYARLTGQASRKYLDNKDPDKKQRLRMDVTINEGYWKKYENLYHKFNNLSHEIKA